MKKAAAALLAMQRHNREQGTAAQAFPEAGERETALFLAVEGANRQLEDGRCCQIGYAGAVTDPCAVGEALLFACEKTGDPFLWQAKDRLLGWALDLAPRSETGTVYHVTDAPEFWVDSFYMLPPFLAAAGEYSEALKQVNGLWDALFLPDKNLLAHRYDGGAKAFIRKDAWGVGNGWALAGMARVRGLLPESFAPEKELLAARVRTLLDAALPLQREDGLFHDVLDDASTFPEANFGQMLAYTVYRGVKEGWLAEKYLPAAEKARASAHRLVDEYGLVRQVCGMPSFDRPFVAPEAQAFFILMEAARAALYPN